MTRDELLKKLADILEELFEIDPKAVVSDAKLYDDLDLDSIDAIDLIVRIQSMTDQRINAEEFKTVRTVGDVLDCLEKLMASNDAAK